MERSFSAVVVLGEPDDYISGERQALVPVAAKILELQPGGASAAPDTCLSRKN
jgi:hypothetical protein